MPWRLGLGALIGVLIWPTIILAAQEGQAHHASLEQLPFWSVIPFAGLLLSIALLPLIAEHFWHSNLNRFLVAMGFSIPVIVFLLYQEYYVYRGKDLTRQPQIKIQEFSEAWGTEAYPPENEAILLAEATVKEEGQKLLFTCTEHGPEAMTLTLQVEEAHEDHAESDESHGHKSIEFLGGESASVWEMEVNGKEEPLSETGIVKVHPGDLITWKVKAGKHGVVFPSQEQAEAVLEFHKQPGLLSLEHSLIGEYVPFIVLLGSLYVISGGIVLSLNIRPGPLVNGILLAIGAVLANFIGTTGASMLLIRPYLRINKPRQNVGHLPIFFIFMVSNLGGLLTPLGDPPLFLGFLRGIDFFWTTSLWPQWLLANGLVLSVFLVWDTVAYSRDPFHSAETTPEPPDVSEKDAGQFRIRGLINFLLLVGVIGAVLAKPIFREELGEAFPANLASEGIMVCLGIASMLLTPRTLRKENGYSWAPIIEVAALFVGIFITMVPALALLQEHGHEFGLSEPWQYFWLTGSLSGFLDNAPTYLTFATMASGAAGIASLPQMAPQILAAISCGAVFLGAMTYIGNGPNFMVKAISDEQNYRTPSFFGYMVYSISILVPIFILIMFVFFSPLENP